MGNIVGLNSVEYGGFHQNYAAHSASLNIKTFTKGIADVDELETAKKWCEDANIMIFLGFAYLPLNIKALKPNSPFSTKTIYGTCLGVSDDNVRIAKNSIGHYWFDAGEIEMDFRKVRCHELLEELLGVLLESDILLKANLRFGSARPPKRAQPPHPPTLTQIKAKPPLSCKTR